MVIWLIVGLLFGICFSAIGLGCYYQLKRLSACEKAIHELKNRVKSKGSV